MFRKRQCKVERAVDVESTWVRFWADVRSKGEILSREQTMTSEKRENDKNLVMEKNNRQPEKNQTLWIFIPHKSEFSNTQVDHLLPTLLVAPKRICGGEKPSQCLVWEMIVKLVQILFRLHLSPCCYNSGWS